MINGEGGRTFNVSHSLDREKKLNNRNYYEISQATQEIKHRKYKYMNKGHNLYISEATLTFYPT